MSALGIVANKGGCRAIRSIISKWQMHSFRVKIKYLTLFVPRLLMISPHTIPALRVFVVKIRPCPFSLLYFRIIRVTGRLTLAPECVSSAHFANTPDAARTILVCCLFELLSMIRTEKVVVPGEWGAGHRGENVLNCWGPMTSADAPRNYIYKRNLAPSAILYYTRFPRAAV